MGDEPGLSAPVTLHLRGDWGQANMHRICGWIAQEIGDRAPAGSRFAVWSGRGGADAITALREREADISIITPTAAVRMLARTGGLDGLRSLGVIGQWDRLVVAVDAGLPVHSVAELAEFTGRLTVATSPDDGVNLVGLAAHKALAVAGVDAGRLDFVYDERPFPCIERFADAHADVLVHEAVMTPRWQHLDRLRPVKYLPWGDDVLRAFAAEGWGAAVVPAGFLPGLTEDLHTLDFSDFAVLCREDLPEEVAYLATWCMVRTRRALEAQYAHLPADRSPVTYPLVPADMARTPIALHPAAARAYMDLGADDAPDDPLMWG
ncbi:TAXI family TRAP transporter solute-binding subunit [Embleya sp. NPDC008237]|uniref:TAXI family TRAP transporter solute-binding subunit n=1 Tax=Embleya sp. NPDC008237 TaxID=3363978 RepID=UPI0036E7DB7D